MTEQEIITALNNFKNSFKEAPSSPVVIYCSEKVKRNPKISEIFTELSKIPNVMVQTITPELINNQDFVISLPYKAWYEKKTTSRSR